MRGRRNIWTAETLAAGAAMDGDCLVWRRPGGGRYGQVRQDGKFVYVHRLAYTLSVGPIPPGMCVCHRCDNPRCIRPDHLFLGTDADNTRDKVMKGRQSRGESHGTAVLRSADVQAIRGEVARGRSQRAVAKQFGVGQMQVSRIVRGQRWGHLEAPCPT